MKRNEGNGRSIKEFVETLHLQGFASHNYLSEEEQYAFESELFRQVKTITNDSAANGTHFFTIPTVHRFPDETQMLLSINFLYNKEAATLDIHSVHATLGDLQERFLPDEQKTFPDPSFIRSMLEHKTITQKALKLQEHQPSKRLLTR